MGDVATKVGLHVVLWQLVLPTGVFAKTMLTTNYRVDTEKLTPGVNYAQIHTTQTGLKTVGSEKLPIVQTQFDFYHLLVDTNDETPVIGPTPDGEFNDDVEVFASREFWRSDSDTFTNAGVRDIDLPGGAPVVTLERQGDVMHHSISIGLILEEA